MTTTNEPELFEILRRIRYDATAIQAKVTDALTMLANTNLPGVNAPSHFCPHAQCRLAFHSDRRLNEHLANVHGVPARANPTASSSSREEIL